LSTHGLLKLKNAPKPVFGQGFATDPAGGAYDAPPDTLYIYMLLDGDGEHPHHSSPYRRVQRLNLAAFGASLLTTPLSYNSYTASVRHVRVLCRNE